MAKIKSFEDLEVWKKARELVKEIYNLTSRFPSIERFNLVDQLRRAAVSIMSNIAEGFSRYHKAETIMFYRSSRGSLSEVKSLLYVCYDQELIKKEQLDNLIQRIDEIGKMLNGLIKVTSSFRN